ncbi:Autotransporter beta-domain-containing protein [Tardiphaga sp. OK245]|nr:Autotransporter beta-domain-containing protein [Tardiphaga sp. OK245]
MRSGNAHWIAYALPQSNGTAATISKRVTMRDPSRYAQTDRSPAASRQRRTIVLGLAVALVAAPSLASAQVAPPPTTPPPTTPPPTPPLPAAPMPSSTDFNAGQSAGIAIGDLGSQFLRRLGDQASYGFNRASRANPGGGGASETTETPRFRSWAEFYGVGAHTSTIGDFVGDKRRTVGGVAGIGARLMPGVNVGLSVDQSHTTIDVPLALQSATLDLTQIGLNASVDQGAWTWAIALVHGFGDINSRRDTGLGLASAGYNARIDGALTELSYYWSYEQARIVPKAAFEYTRATTGAMQELGGLNPVNASGASAERARILIGAEVGRYWIFDQKILDLSGYAKFVDNVHQRFSNVTVSLGSESITVQGIGESQYGADAGASASLSLSNTARLYLNYDGKFRAYSQSHQGTLGIEFKF